MCPTPIKVHLVHCFYARYDFVLKADQDPGTYLMRFAGLFDCAKLEAHEAALLHYETTQLQPLEEDTSYQVKIQQSQKTMLNHD